MGGSTTELLQAKEQELATMVAQWAIENGLASIPQQVRVSVKIIRQVTTVALTEQDWKIILSDAYEWLPEEVVVLEQLRLSNNQPVLVACVGHTDDYKDIPAEGMPRTSKMQSHFQARKNLPYFLVADSVHEDIPDPATRKHTFRGYMVQIRKRLVNVKRKRRND